MHYRLIVQSCTSDYVGPLAVDRTCYLVSHTLFLYHFIPWYKCHLYTIGSSISRSPPGVLTWVPYHITLVVSFWELWSVRFLQCLGEVGEFGEIGEIGQIGEFGEVGEIGQIGEIDEISQLLQLETCLYAGLKGGGQLVSPELAKQ